MRRIELDDPSFHEGNALVKSSMADMVMTLCANEDAKVAALQQATRMLEEAAGEVTVVLNRKLAVAPDGSFEIDRSEIYTISSDGKRR